MRHLPPDARASVPDECPCGRFATGRCKWCRTGFCDLHAELVEDQLYCAACDAALHLDAPHNAALPSPPGDTPPAPVAAEPQDAPPVPATPPRPDPSSSASPSMAVYAAWADAFIARMSSRVKGGGRTGVILETLGAELIYHAQNPDLQAGVAFSIGWKVRDLPVTSRSYATGQYLILPDDVFPAGGVITTYSNGDRTEAVFDSHYDGPLFGPVVADRFMRRMTTVETQLDRIAAGKRPAQ